MRVFFFVTLFLMISLHSFSQQTYYTELKGYEDENNNTHLFYQLNYPEASECVFYLGQDYVMFNDIYHYDVEKNSENYFLKGDRREMYTDCSFSDRFRLDGYGVYFKQTESDTEIKNSRIRSQWFKHDYPRHFFIGNARVATFIPANNFHRIINHPYDSEQFLLEFYVDEFPDYSGSRITHALKFEYPFKLEGGYQYESFDQFGELRDLSYKFLNPNIQRSDSLAFFFKGDSLYHTYDLNLTSEVSIPNLRQYLYPDTTNAASTFRMCCSEYLNIYYPQNSDDVFWFVSLNRNETDRIYHFLLHSSDKGQLGTWNKYPISLYAGDEISEIHFELNSESDVFVGYDQVIYLFDYETNQLDLYLFFENEIKGMYKKPNSDLLYVLTTDDILEVNTETRARTSLKQLPVSNESSLDVPNQITLDQNYPNPFNPSTVIRYQLTENSVVRLEVFDVTGQKVATLVDGDRKTSGTHRVNFDASGLASGIYFYSLKTDGQTLTQKMLLVK